MFSKWIVQSSYLSINYCILRRYKSFRISKHMVTKMLPNFEAHVRIKNEQENFYISFMYCVKELGINQHLNFSRSLSEPIGLFLNRLEMKINGTCNKKQKKKNKKQPILAIKNDTVPVSVVKDGIVVSAEDICKNVFEGDANLKLLIGDQEYTVITNSPWIERISLPKSIMCGYAVYPLKFEAYFSNEDECEFLWYRVMSERNEFVGSGIIYVPVVEDVGCKLMLVCTPKRSGISGIPVEIFSPSKVEANPGLCPFELRHSFTDETLNGNVFRVVSYNILAELYASSGIGKNELFCYCPPYALAMDYRKQLIMKELRGYNADIICLQEVDCRIFNNDLTRILKLDGFEGEFAKKGGEVNEGIACFYRKTRFKLLSSQRLTIGENSEEFQYLSHIWNAISKNEILFTKMKERNTAAQILVFECLEKPKHKLIVGNTHLYFHPKADHIRLLQAGICLGYVYNLLNQLKQEDSDSNISVIFCGDFNSTPECGVYKLFTTNYVPQDYHEWICEDGETVQDLSLHNPITFESACGTPEFTNYTPNFADCLDYIFFQIENLQVKEVVPFPCKEDVSRNLGIPSVVFPSDHVALVADLMWK